MQTGVVYHLSSKKVCPTEESRSDFQIEMFGAHADMGGFAPIGSTDYSPQRFTIEDEEEEIMF